MRTTERTLAAPAGDFADPGGVLRARGYKERADAIF